MREETFFLLSLFLAVTGIALLHAFSQSLVSIETDVSSLSGEDVGKSVFVKGKVAYLFSSASYSSFLLCSSGCVKVVSFKPLQALSQGAFVSVEGPVGEFQGDLQVVAVEVEVLRA